MSPDNDEVTRAHNASVRSELEQLEFRETLVRLDHMEDPTRLYVRFERHFTGRSAPDERAAFSDEFGAFVRLARRAATGRLAERERVLYQEMLDDSPVGMELVALLRQFDPLHF